MLELVGEPRGAARRCGAAALRSAQRYALPGHCRPLGRDAFGDPMTTETVDPSQAAAEERVLLDSAVKAVDGFFTTYFVSPYSKYIARWAARRGLTPNQITTVSMAIGVLAARAFATGERRGWWRARCCSRSPSPSTASTASSPATRAQFSKLGAWLDSIFDRGRSTSCSPAWRSARPAAGQDVWVLAGAALALQTVRHASTSRIRPRQRQVIDATTHMPLEQPRTAGARRGPPTRRTPRRRTAAARGRPHRAPSSRGVRWRASSCASGAARPLRVVPLDQADRRLADRRALRADLDHRRAVRPRVTFIVLLAWGGVRRRLQPHGAARADGGAMTGDAGLPRRRAARRR